MTDPVRPGRPEAAATIWSWRARDGAPARRAASLRREGMLRAVVAGIVGGLLLFFGRTIVGSIALGIGSLTLVLALASPTGAYAALSRAVERVGQWIGIALTWLLLAPVFYLFFAPFGLLARRGRRDRLGRRFDRDATSYWARRSRGSSIDRPY